ncbi:hypothetical protein [Parafrankia discariae]|uniref:hypothetical protein n=1 Tax=Parafrankia discariae TaxID=365528 RepID=UPI000368A7CC|nr:hypothetical protein [Parafrankia discariae]
MTGRPARFTITRRALPDRAREAAEQTGRTFDTRMHPTESRLQYVIDGQPMTPGEAADLLGIPLFE